MATKLKNLQELYMQNNIQEHKDKHKAHKKKYSVVIKSVKTNYTQHIITTREGTSCVTT
jgi:hypothetical protein